jgi:hypothetical protein
MTHHIKGHHVHFIENRCRRIAKQAAQSTPNQPPALPALLDLIAQTKHQPSREEA